MHAQTKEEKREEKIVQNHKI